MKKMLTLVLLFFLSTQMYSQYYDYEIKFDTGAVYFDLATDTQHAWQVGPPQKSFLNGANSLPNVLMTDTILNYPDNAHYFTDIFIPNDCHGHRITFQYKCASEKYKDGVKIEMSFDRVSWFNIAYRDSFTHHYDSSYSRYYSRFQTSFNEIPQDSLYTGEPGISGHNNWKEFYIFASFSEAEKTNNFDSWLRFTFLSNRFNNDEGFMMDDFAVAYECGGGIHDLNNTFLDIYPNPVNNYLSIQNSDDENYTARLYSIDGVFINEFSIKPERNEIDLNFLSRGAYLLNFVDKQGNIFYKKLVKE